ncbi:MAG: thiamine-monophosphate kinase [Planctomycetota bacterium]
MVGAETPPGGERRFVDWLQRFFRTRDARVKLGIGDDAALLVPRGSATVVCCDPVVEGVHFRAGTPLGAVGHKVVMRNASDLAAMGARADALLVSVVAPRGLASTALKELFRGIRRAARQLDASVVGGDLAASDGPMVVTVTAVGSLHGRALRRDRARVGDAVFVSGPLGGSILGRHLRIRPRLDVGERLARMRGVGAVLDISDGLVLDLMTLLAASSPLLGADLHADRIPIHRDARRLAGQSGGTAMSHALGDGEDHELLFTLRPTAARRVGALEALGCRRIGSVTPSPGVRLVDDQGLVVPIESLGYEHVLPPP